MPRLSRSLDTSSQQGPATEWSADLEGYTASIVKLASDSDLTEVLRGLPNDQCPSPHWGYVIAGSMWFRSSEDSAREVFEAGDAFHVPPGHTAGASAGAEFVIFSPTAIMSEVEAHLASRAQELFGV